MDAIKSDHTVHHGYYFLSWSPGCQSQIMAYECNTQFDFVFYWITGHIPQEVNGSYVYDLQWVTNTLSDIQAIRLSTSLLTTLPSQSQKKSWFYLSLINKYSLLAEKILNIINISFCRVKGAWLNTTTQVSMQSRYRQILDRNIIEMCSSL